MTNTKTVVVRPGELEQFCKKHEICVIDFEIIDVNRVCLLFREAGMSNRSVPPVSDRTFLRAEVVNVGDMAPGVICELPSECNEVRGSEFFSDRYESWVLVTTVQNPPVGLANGITKAVVVRPGELEQFCKDHEICVIDFRIIDVNRVCLLFREAGMSNRSVPPVSDRTFLRAEVVNVGDMAPGVICELPSECNEVRGSEFFSDRYESWVLVTTVQNPPVGLAD